jgi:two-component system sensor kinase FixL
MENAVLLNAIIDHAVDGLITIDDRGKIESINPSSCKLFEYTEKEVRINSAMPIQNTDTSNQDAYLAKQRSGNQSPVGLRTTITWSILTTIQKINKDMEFKPKC